MSSLRNAVKRITHKERSQPQGRSHLGILEKKKDYVKRAKDYHKKQDIINKLKQKASMRNPDEFYFGMNKSEIRNGQHQKTQQTKQQEFDAAIGHETIRLMKDQDLSYLRLQRAKDLKRVEKLQASLHSLGNGSAERKHTIFVDGKEQVASFDAAQHFDTLPELVGRSYNRTRTAQVRQMASEAMGYAANHEDESSDHDEDAQKKNTPLTSTTTTNLTPQELKEQAKWARKSARKLAKARASAYRELEARTQRSQALEQAEAHLVTQKLVAGKGVKRKIKEAENGKPAQYVWRRKRQK
mmetsp:Transcript_13159/g.28885  ORF Transcript_13159/g.28885 Transcript_13159/m.28885 type:complete len:298 (-) Transcript_13159:83-976(-)|eukprot:CAMPEP_0168818768 /NCGR_PEP_ID=MMETSP0726-20121227/7929_1 /TAXON_ID=265536 /ORGANISM="Amphiprora sp., Strain CCMP467" /LENGTH=297 /DNA_ID=CAMNT_0008871109 /DNA_START=44 /DNA_END=937 /DNA_ORIENTATION=+